MSKRLILGLLVIAGLATVALWSQSPVAAQAQTAPETASKAQATVPGGDKRKKAVYEDYIKDGVVRKRLVYKDVKETPADDFGRTAKTTAEAEAIKTGPVLPKATEWVAESVVVDGVVQTIMAAREVKDVKTPQERYLEFHRRIAERLTPEQLAEKCQALEKELNELVAEDEIEQIQKQLSELKQKNAGHKGISTRLQRAIEALGAKSVSGESFKSL